MRILYFLLLVPRMDKGLTDFFLDGMMGTN